MILPASYEYAGFRYVIDGTPSRLVATPAPGQHKAAWKEKHRQAALSCFLQDHGGACD